MNARWLSFLPGPLRQRLEGRHLLQKILGNSGWLVADKVVRMGVALVVSVWIARYLGPKDFGLLNYAIAFVAIFSVFASMGLQGIVIRDLVRRPDERKTLLASAFFLRLIGAALSIGLAAIVVVILRPDDHMAWALVIILATALLPQAADVIDFLYQAEANVKPVVLIRNGVFLLFAGVKVAIILGQGTVITFAIAFSAEILLVAIVFLLYADRSGLSFRFRDVTRAECLRLAKESWPLVFAGLSIAVYMRIDQVMLGEMLGDTAVGIYSAAVRISEVWYFIPVSIMAAVGPTLTALHQTSREAYESKLASVMGVLVWMAILFAIGLTFLSPRIISGLYGMEYEAAAPILVIHGWAAVFVSLGIAGGYWLTNAGLLKFSMYQSIAGAFINVSANMVLIPWLGIVGAAISTVLSQAISAFLFNIMMPPTRYLFKIQLRSILPRGQKL